MKFLPEASMGKVTTTIYINSLDPHVLEWAKKLHIIVLPRFQILIKDSNDYTPSNSTMGILAPSILLMKEYLEKNLGKATKVK